MLRNSKDLDNFAIRATDGEIGKVKDMYFDDDAWVMRYFVVDTGSWLSSRKVLVSPMSVQEPDWKDKTLPVSITKAQVSNSPNIDTDMPVSRQNEEEYLGYYGYTNYWEGEGIWGEGMYPYMTAPQYLRNRPDWIERQREDEAALDAERARHRNDDVCAATPPLEAIRMLLLVVASTPWLPHPGDGRQQGSSLRLGQRSRLRRAASRDREAGRARQALPMPIRCSGRAGALGSPPGRGAARHGLRTRSLLALLILPPGGAGKARRVQR